MMINNWIQNLFNNDTEQRMAEELIIEAIQINGFDIVYMPRENYDVDEILGDVKNITFDRGFRVEAYLMNSEGWVGNSYSIDHTGFHMEETAKFVISRYRFNQECQTEYPKAGDLIYFPLPGTLMEITLVDFENPFYQLGKLFTFTITCKLFQYNGEDLKTTEEEIDDVQRNNDYQFFVALGSGGTGNFAKDDIVYQGNNIDEATFMGIVTSWDQCRELLYIRTPRGLCQPGELKSSTDPTLLHTITEVHTGPVSGYANNNDFTETVESILNLSEKNPLNNL
jgi:hypothetical protein